MRVNTASRTAQYMALYRAIESERPRNRRLFDDPYAIHFLDKGLQIATRTAALPLGERLLYSYMQRRIPGALASGLARTRYIDDLLEKTIREGIRQVIVLGAGYDTRSLRLNSLHDVRVIEIDHPDTARRKLELLKRASIPLPDNTRYLTIDFNRQDLRELFDQQRVDCSLPTTLIWEGVTNYLEEEAIAKTFILAAKFPAGSHFIFTYIDRKVLEEPTAFFGAERLLKDLNEIEEKWTFGFTPAALPAYLSILGWKLQEDTGAADYRQRYLSERTAILRGYEFYRVAMAIRS